MFGYIVANRAALTKAQAQRYRACYCGLCRALKQRHGSLSRLALSYDMAFVALLLSSLYEPETASGRERCAAHPLHSHDYWQNCYSGYAADMNIALSYYKCLDDWTDERKAPEYLSARLLRPAYQRVKAAWPRQCAAIEAALTALSRLEQENCAEPDRMAGLFGSLMAELLVYAEDNWSPILRQLGGALGAFIYIMDAAVDLAQDQSRGLYNPLLAFAAANGGDLPEQAPILTMLMGDTAREFEKLPLVQDQAILRNIIYSGVWQRYNAKYKTSPVSEEADWDRSAHGSH